MHIQYMHICINSTNYKVGGFRYRRRKLRCATFQVKNIFLLPLKKFNFKTFCLFTKIHTYSTSFLSEPCLGRVFFCRVSISRLSPYFSYAGPTLSSGNMAAPPLPPVAQSTVSVAHW